MPGKKFQARLEKLLSSEDSTTQGQEPEIAFPIPGWFWECDQEKRFTYCSNDIEQALGVPASELIGKDLLSYRLDALSTELLKQAFQNLDQPKWIPVKYQDKSELFQPIHLYILGSATNANQETIFRGFTQLGETTDTRQTVAQASAESQPPAHKQSSAPSLNSVHPIQVDFNKIKIANQLILEMLKHLMESTPFIRSASEKQVVSKTEHKLIAGPGPGLPQATPSGLPTQANERHTTVSRLEHRLEWGIKLDLTSKERDFLDKNLYLDRSLAGKLQQQIAPKTITRANKYWIGITILAGEEQPSCILVQSKQALSNLECRSIQDFLNDPFILIADINQAIENPFYVNEVYQRGVDYLIARD